MSAAADQANFPTMIIPRGTEIRVNQQGQLSIKTPGNLVIQNSGVYSELESTNGSIRIEENVTVEAVSIKAAQACFIQGTVTAWKVHAKRIALEDRARAFIMLQESEQLELSRTARLVGNFANEKELYLMMGKFTSQLRELPGSMDVTPQPAIESRTMPMQSISAPQSTVATQAIPRTESSDVLRAVQVQLEKEMARPDLATNEVEALRELLFALRERNLQRVGLIYRDAFAEVKNPSEALRHAYDQLAEQVRSAS